MSFLANDLRLSEPSVCFLIRGESGVPIVEFGPKEFCGELRVALPGVKTDGMAAMMDCMVTAPRICRDRLAVEKKNRECNGQRKGESLMKAAFEDTRLWFSAVYFALVSCLAHLPRLWA